MSTVYIVYLLGSILVQPLVVTLYPDPGAHNPHNPTSHFPLWFFNGIWEFTSVLQIVNCESVCELRLHAQVNVFGFLCETVVLEVYCVHK